jgi:uridine kinase
MDDVLPRGEALQRLARALAGPHPGHVPRVAVDGPDAAGKTTFADDLAGLVSARRPVIRASIDGWHHPAERRHQRGSESAGGYYLDSFDNEAIISGLLRPLGPRGDRRYLTAIYDFRSGQPVPARTRTADGQELLLFDGVFLQRAELRGYWDFVIYLHVSPAETMRRALVRDLALFGGAGEVRRRYSRRYLPGQDLYRRRDDPAGRADVVPDMTDPSRPAGHLTLGTLT